MKKVIAAAAGLMLVGAMVGTASAAVSFGGDARARYYYQQDYDFGAIVQDEETGAISRVREQDNKWQSRVRIQARAEAAGGAYAVARYRIGDGTWDGGRSGTATDYFDKAYIGVPMGPVTFEGGRMGFNLLPATKFLYEDVTEDGAKLLFPIGDAAEIAVLYTMNYEAVTNGDLINDNDIQQFGGWAKMGFGGMSVRVAGLYRDDAVNNDIPGVPDVIDTSGFFGGIEFTGPAGPVALSGAIAMDDRGENRDNTGYGGFLQGGMDFGGTGVALNVGWTQDGYVADGDFGFIMIGGGYSITPIAVGSLGDTFWIGMPVTFAVSEMLSLKGILAYADFDTGGDGFEISGSAVYVISDGANFQFDIGYLGYSADNDLQPDESPFGMAGTFNISF